MLSKFISFESGEGAGKTTQAKRLAQRLRSHGHDVVLTREPGGTPLAERIRGLILSGAAKVGGPELEATLFAAARADHVGRVIRPALSAGSWVITDRFFDSTRVYQTLCGLDPSICDALEVEACGDCRPSLTIVLDIEDEIALSRAVTRRGAEAADRFESEATSFHASVRAGFVAIAHDDPVRCRLIPANGSIDQVHERIYSSVAHAFGFNSD